MVFLIYLILFSIFVLYTGVILVLSNKKTSINRVAEDVITKSYFGTAILFLCSSVFTLIYGIVLMQGYMIYISSFTIALALYLFFIICIWEKATFKHEALVTGITIFLYASWFVSNIIVLYGGTCNYESISREEVIEKIDIVPYSEVSENHFYLKLESVCSYYYNQKGEDGDTVTRCIDGAKNYVVRYEDSEYENNAHIKVAEVYANNWYGFEIPVRNNYYIYIPTNSVLYE